MQHHKYITLWPSGDLDNYGRSFISSREILNRFKKLLQLCAGGTLTEESACPGDSGGGLQIQDDLGRWTLVGIVSNGPSVCGLQPVVFHKVENSIDWIVRTMQYRQSTP